MNKLEVNLIFKMIYLCLNLINHKLQKRYHFFPLHIQTRHIKIVNILISRLLKINCTFNIYVICKWF